MVYFCCDACGETIKKLKLQNHWCGGHTFSCVDCCQVFDRNSAKGHNVCVSEHEKYALGATKPGGFAANGTPASNQAQQPATPGEPSGLEFLSTRPPWKCSICNVSCTSKETLMSHASGIKHKRKARAALNAQNGTQNGTVTAANGTTEGQQGNGTIAQPQETKVEASDSKKAKDSTTKPAKQSYTDDQFSKLIKVVRKRLKKKGKVGPKKFRKLTCKKLSLKGDSLDTLLVTSIREKVAAECGARVDGSKIVSA